MTTIRRRAFVPVVVLALLLPAAYAQTSFGDVPESHWAEEAVARIADLGIVTGFPDGTFQGNAAVTRYQVALIVSRLLDAIEPNLTAAGGADAARTEALRTDLESLAAIAELQRADVAALEDALGTRASAAEAEELRNRIGALRARIAALDAELERVRAGVAADAPPGPPGPAGAAGGRGDATGADAAGSGGETATPGGSGGAPGEPGGGGFRLGSPAERPDVYLGFGVSTDFRFVHYLPRLTFGADELFGPLGARLSIDYGRQSGGDFGAGTLAAAAHVTYSARLIGLYPYAGIGGGYQADLLGGGYNAGAFAGALLGVEVPLGGGVGVYVESDLDYYLTSTIAEDGGFQPRLGLGARLRF